MLWSIPISAEAIVTNTPMGARAITHVFFEDKNGGLFERKDDGVDTVSIQIDGKQVLCWTSPKGRGWKDEAVAYVVYRFEKGETIDTEDASHVLTVTNQTHYELPRMAPGRYVYLVTALDRMHNESKAVKKKVKN